MPFYFVYGALMGRGQFKTTGAAATLTDYRVAFSLKTNMFAEPSFASLAPLIGDVAWGVVAELSESEWQKISSHEFSYDLHQVRVTRKDGIEISCFTLISTRAKGIPDIPPSSRYASMLYKAAVFHGFDKDVVERYLHLKTIGNKLTRVLKFIFPLVKLLAPYIHPRYTMCFIVYVLPVLVVVGIIALLAYFF